MNRPCTPYGASRHRTFPFRVFFSPIAAFSFAVCSFACSSSPADTPVDAEPPPPVDAGETPPPPPLFSHTRGFYTEPFELQLRPPLDNIDVLYTTDGSDPYGPGALVYEQPLTIDTTTVVRVALTVEGDLISRTVTHTFIFADHIANQQQPDGYPDEWWGHHATGPWPADYQMDSEVVNDPRATGRFPAVFSEATTVSVSLDPGDVFGLGGIHENAWLGGSLWERGGSLEIFEPMDPDNQVQINCAISIHGASSREPDRTTKKSFRAEFKSRYGPKKLNYRVFDDSPVEEFDVLVLRGGYNRTWTHFVTTQRTRAQYVREAYGAELQRAMGHPAPRAKHAHFYLNGLYWGLFWIQERPNAAFQASYLGGSKSDYDTLNSGRPIDGDRVAWDHMMSIVEFGLDTPKAYATLREWLDIENFADYMLLQHWLGNLDWPDRNWYAGRHRSNDGKFLFFSWDSEIVLGDVNSNVIDRNVPDSPGRIFHQLRDNEEFVVYFGDRIHKHLFNDGVLMPAAAAERWNRIAAIAEPLVVAESARWGDHVRDERANPEGELYTLWEHWQPEQERMRELVFPVRTDIVIQQYRDVGLYPAFDAPVFSRFGGSVPSGTTLDITGADVDRDVYYTLDGSDPRMPGGAISASAISDSRPIALTADATVKARVRLQSGEWSALVEAAFTVQ